MLDFWKVKLVEEKGCHDSQGPDKAGKESDDEEHARLVPNDTRNPDCGQRGLQSKNTCILDQGRERAYKSIGEVAKSPEEPELESAQEEVEVVGKVEGEKVQVLASAVGGREVDKKTETEAAEATSKRRTRVKTLLCLLS